VLVARALGLCVHGPIAGREAAARSGTRAADAVRDPPDIPIRTTVLAEEVRTINAGLSAKVDILLASQIRTDDILRQSGEKVDERIGKLVNAIGELIRRMPATGSR
jgi:hypothetical protein